MILADYSLPSFDGFAALTIAHQLCPDIPFIFVTGVMGEDIAVETLKRGATDYVLKQKMERFGPAVRRALSESVERKRRRRAEAELTQSEEQLRLLVDAVRDYALYMVDMAGIVVSWNSGAARILGYSEQEIVGSSFSRFFCGDDRQESILNTCLMLPRGQAAQKKKSGIYAKTRVLAFGQTSFSGPSLTEKERHEVSPPVTPGYHRSSRPQRRN